MEHHVDSSVWHHDHGYPPPPKEESRDWTGTIALVLVILLIIGIIVVFIIWERGGTNALTGSWIWTFVQGSSSSATDTFTGNNGSMYVGNNTAPLTLTIVAPTEPIGKQFAVTNETGNAITLSGTSETITNGTIVFVWTTANKYITVSST